MSDDLNRTIERLRTALDETAAQLDLTTPRTSVVASNRRSRRPTALVAAAAAAAVAGAIVTGGLLLRSGRDQPSVSTSQVVTSQEVTPEELTHLEADLEIYLDVDASGAEIAEVRALIENDRRVRQFAYLSHRDSYAEFARIFADQEDLIENVTPQDLPVSFRVELVDPNDPTLALDLERLSSISEIMQPTTPFESSGG